MTTLSKALQAAAGNAGEALYVEDVFSTYLYTGNGSTQTITNGIDLAGEGGLVWIKSRILPQDHVLVDTVRGGTKVLTSDAAYAEATASNTINSFNSDGYSFGLSSAGFNINSSNSTYASWTFRKAEKFFDVVTYVGNGVTGRTVAHNLGSVPGCIIVKCTNTTGDWAVYHRGVNGGTNPERYKMLLNSTNAQALDNWWNDTAPTSTSFQVSSDPTVNANGWSYVAYLFAHNAGGFGDDGTENVISCGSFSISSSDVTVNLGWEPQWVLLKNSSSASDWIVVDNMRGMPVSGNGANLRPNKTDAEGTYNFITPNATGFTIPGGNFGISGSGIYIAIRRGPMKTPESGTEVFKPLAYSGDNTDPRILDYGFVTDAVINNMRAGTSHPVVSRLTGTNRMYTASTGAEVSNDINGWDSQVGVSVKNYSDWNYTAAFTYVSWAFKRAPGFFDVVCYSGNYSANQVKHNLNVVPELVILKARTASSAFDAWLTGALFGSSSFTQLFLNTVDQAQSSSYGFFDYLLAAPTSDTISIGRSDIVNASGGKYVAYLFATCPGVSKVGSYTGTGSAITVDCGFTSGARFIMIKRTDAAAGWIVFDSARGIVAGADPYLYINNTDAESSTDAIDPYSSGFIVNPAGGALNSSGGSYIFLAIA